MTGVRPLAATHGWRPTPLDTKSVLPQCPTVGREIPAIADALARLTAADLVHVTAPMVRVIDAFRLARRPDGSQPTLLFTQGYRIRHSRFVGLGAFAALHLADGVTTGGAEAAGGDTEEVPLLGPPKESQVHLRVEVDVPGLLDLRTDEDCKRLRVSRHDLLRVTLDPLKVDTFGRPPTYELPQAIGRLAYQAGVSGLRYTSARATAGANVVLFVDHLATWDGRVRTVDPVSGTAETLP